jgi:hypothetical protein
MIRTRVRNTDTGKARENPRRRTRRARGWSVNGAKRAQPAANGGKCRGRKTAPTSHGKEGVDGSSPSEGFEFPSCLADALVVSAGDRERRRPRSVHRRPPWPLSGTQLVEPADRMFASVACDVAVVAVDHCQAGAYGAGEIEGGDAGTEREGREDVWGDRRSCAELDSGGEGAGFHWRSRKLCRSQMA